MRVETITTAVDGTTSTKHLYSKHINLFNAFSPDNLKIYQKAASLTYGDTPFSLTDNQELRELSGDELTGTGRVSTVEKEVDRDRIHSTFLATQLMKMLGANRKLSFELKSKLYTQTSSD